jgi:hypothetical protein
MMYTFTILLTFADGRTEIVTQDHSFGRYASLHAKKESGAKSAKILSRKAQVTPEQNALWRELTGENFG